MRAAVYCRISDDSTGQMLGVTRQREDCLELAVSLGWEVTEVYVDNDISATSGRPRPGYRQMLSDIDAGLAEAIIAWHPDRLYRRAVDLGELVEVCKRTSAQVATVNAGTVDLTTPTGRLVAGLLAQVATYEGEHKAERWNRSYRQARESGRIPKFGHRMFGWTRDGEIIPVEAGIIRSMARDVLNGVSIRGICKQLTADGVLTTRGNPWQPATVRNLLRNPRLAGHSTARGRIVGKGAWEPILDAEISETIRALLQTRSKPQPIRVSLLSGLIHCGSCGHPLITGAHKNGGRAYRCVARPGNTEACGGVIGSAQPVEIVVETFARARLNDPEVRSRITRLRSAGRGVAKEIDALETRLVEIEAAMADSGESLDALLRAADTIRARLAKLHGQLAASVPAQIPAGHKWPTDLDQRRRLVELVVAKVWLDPSPARGGRFVPERVRIEGV